MTKENRNLLIFIVATLATTFVCYFTIVLNGWNPYGMPGLVVFLLGGGSPTWIGLLMVLFIYDKPQRKDYFRRLLPRLISGRWWAIIVLFFPFLFVIVYAIALPLGDSLPGMEALRSYIANPASLPLVVLMGIGSGPLSEEFGWRGIALDPLMKRYGRIPGALFLGLIWGVWHLGLFFMPQTWHGQMGFRFAGFPSFMLATVGLSLVMAWVHLNTHGSILAAIMMHFFNNFTSTALAPQSDLSEIVRMVVLLVLGLGLCLAMQRSPKRQAATAPGG